MVNQSLRVFFLYLKRPRIDAKLCISSRKTAIFVDFKRRNELIWISLIHNVLRKDSRPIYGGSQELRELFFVTVSILFLRSAENICSEKMQRGRPLLPKRSG